MTQDQDSVGQTPVSSANPKRWHVGTLSYTTTGLVVIFCWLLWGDFAWSMRDRSVPVVIQVLLSKFGASDVLVGFLLVLLPSALSILITPIISYKSDRHRGRWGRRIPFLLIATPIIVASIIGVAFSPNLGEWVHRAFGPRSYSSNTAVLFFIGLFWTLFGCGCATANAVFGALVNDVVPEAVLGRFFAMFRALSLIAGMIFNYWIFGHADTEYVWIFLGVGALYGIGFTLMCFNVKEGDYPPAPVEPHRAGAFWPAAKTYFKDCFSHSYYLWFFGAMALALMTLVPVNTYALYFASSLKMTNDDYGKCMTLTFLISLVMAYPLGSLADRFHPLRISMVSLGLYACVMWWGARYATDARTFSIALVAHGVLAGTFLTAASSLGQRLLPRSRFAELSSAAGIVACLVTIALTPVAGILLDHTHHTYRYTFYMGLVLALLALLAFWVVYSKFMALGGPKNYVAPSMDALQSNRRS